MVKKLTKRGLVTDVKRHKQFKKAAKKSHQKFGQMYKRLAIINNVIARHRSTLRKLALHDIE